jgi:hypothetical protein
MFEDSIKEFTEIKALHSERSLALAKMVYKDIEAAIKKFEHQPLGAPYISCNWSGTITIDNEMYYSADLTDETNE